jgi:hypothetical protein
LIGVSLDVLYGHDSLVGHDQFPSSLASPAADFEIIVAGDGLAKATLCKLPTDDFTCIEVDLQTTALLSSFSV